jgi:hypothetical protein
MSTVEILKAAQKEQDAEASQRESDITRDGLLALAKLHGNDEELANTIARYINLLGDRLKRASEVLGGNVPVIDMAEKQ